jgi:hypothetical protein
VHVGLPALTGFLFPLFRHSRLDAMYPPLPRLINMFQLTLLPPLDKLQSHNQLLHHHRPICPQQEVLREHSATVVNGVDVSSVGNGGGCAEGFVFDPESTLKSRPLSINSGRTRSYIMDHSSEFYAS